MKKFLLALMAVAMVGAFMTAESHAGGGKFRADGFTLGNTNDLEGEDIAIRVWVLTEEQAQSPPTTKGEAAGVPSYITFPTVFFSTTREPGNYVIVASNESVFQSLADDDAFTAGEIFSAAAVTLEEGDGFIDVDVENGEESLLPVISVGNE